MTKNPRNMYVFELVKLLKSESVWDYANFYWYAQGISCGRFPDWKQLANKAIRKYWA